MNSIRHKAVLLVAMLILLGSAETRATEMAEGDAGTASGVVAKVERAVVRGATAAASGVERGAKAAAHGIEHGARAAASGVKRGVKAAASGVERGAKATGNAAHTVAEKVDGSPTSTSSSRK